MTEGVSAVPGGSEVPVVAGGAETNSPNKRWGLALGSVGVVYGDIGTSPLYALREAVVAASGPDHAELTRANLLGVVSLIIWALIVVVTLKYVLLLLRADNNGEGGTLTLMALASRAVGRASKAASVVALLGIISAALFYGDAVITPALSVLSAVEGIDVATPAFHEFVVPLTIVVLVLLFAFQWSGTAKVAALFGPVMSVWFVAIALSARSTASTFSPITASSGSLRWARCSWRSPEPKRSTPTSAISAVCRFSLLGFAWCCRRLLSIIWGKAPWCMPIQMQSPIRSFCFIRIGRASRWLCWRRLRPSSPAKQLLPALIR
jgi:hypothetical protein